MSFSAQHCSCTALLLHLQALGCGGLVSTKAGGLALSSHHVFLHLPTLPHAISSAAGFIVQLARLPTSLSFMAAIQGWFLVYL